MREMPVLIDCLDICDSIVSVMNEYLLLHMLIGNGTDHMNSTALE